MRRLMISISCLLTVLTSGAGYSSVHESVEANFIAKYSRIEPFLHHRTGAVNFGDGSQGDLLRLIDGAKEVGVFITNKAEHLRDTSEEVRVKINITLSCLRQLCNHIEIIPEHAKESSHLYYLMGRIYYDYRSKMSKPERRQGHLDKAWKYFSKADILGSSSASRVVMAELLDKHYIPEDERPEYFAASSEGRLAIKAANRERATQLIASTTVKTPEKEKRPGVSRTHTTAPYDIMSRVDGRSSHIKAMKAQLKQNLEQEAATPAAQHAPPPAATAAAAAAAAAAMAINNEDEEDDAPAQPAAAAIAEQRGLKRNRDAAELSDEEGDRSSSRIPREFVKHSQKVKIDPFVGEIQYDSRGRVNWSKPNESLIDYIKTHIERGYPKSKIVEGITAGGHVITLLSLTNVIHRNPIFESVATAPESVDFSNLPPSIEEVIVRMLPEEPLLRELTSAISAEFERLYPGRGSVCIRTQAVGRYVLEKYQYTSPAAHKAKKSKP